MRTPTLREVIAESGGAEVVKRTGKARIEGVDYVRRPAAEWLASGKPTRGTRKPTADELADRWAMVERHWAASCEAAGWRRQLWRVADGRFNLRFQRALLAAIESGAGSKAKRKPAAKPKATRKPTPKPAPVATVAPSGELLRMYRRELLELGTAEAMAEIERRKAKRAAKREARTF